MGGKPTSVYLSATLAEAVSKTGLPLAELIRRGISASQAPGDVVPPAAASWTCGTCGGHQAQPVTYCESFGAGRGVTQ